MLVFANLKMIAMMMASLIGVGLLIYFYRKVTKYFRYRLRDLKALGIYHERTKRFTDPATKVLREKVISDQPGIFVPTTMLDLSSQAVS